MAGGLAVVGAVGAELGAAKGLFKSSPEKAVAAVGHGAPAAATGGDSLDALTISEAAAKAKRLGRLPAATAAVGTRPAPNSFSIFWITDTQFLSESNPALFRMMNYWIVDNWAAYNGKLVIHTGDLVEHGSVQAEFENANDAMSIFLQNGIPYTWCAGNHDDFVQDQEPSGWMGNQWGSPGIDPVAVKGYMNAGYPQGYNTVGYSTVKAKSSVQWVGDFRNGMNTAAAFSANGLNFLNINVEWNADPSVIQWADSILGDPAFANYYVIMGPHAYIDSGGSINDARWGLMLKDFINNFTALLNKYSSNVFLTLNGHFATDSGWNTPAPVNGRNQLMFDRQDCCDYPNDPTGRNIDSSTSSTPDCDKVGGATVTILNFDTINNMIHVSTYDVYTGLWRTEPANQYSIAMFANPPSASSGVIQDKQVGPVSATTYSD